MNNERKPLLSVEKLVDEFCEVHPYHAQIYAKQTACWVRDFYERLITEGKLRVVEEVEWTTDQYGRQVCKRCYEHNKTCKKKDVIPSGIILKTHGANHCPGCGNKIERA
jgi:hypothetical protein